MLRLFGGGKPDHPMGDPKELKRLLDELPAQDAYKALEELDHWIESVGAAEGFKPAHRVQTLTAIDDAAQSRLRKLSRDYFSSARPSRFQENRLWTVLHAYYGRAAGAFSGCVEAARQDGKSARLPKDQVALVVARALRSQAQQLKWLQMRYGPIDPAVWRALNGLYAFAEASGLADLPVAAYAGAETSARREYLRAAMFGASSPDSLLPAEIEIAEAVIAALSERMEIGTEPGPGRRMWIDLEKPMAPQRAITEPPAAASLRFVGAGGAREVLRGALDALESSGVVPSDLPLAGTDPETAHETLNHMAQAWSTKPPERQAPRHGVKSRLLVAHGFTAAVQALGGSRDPFEDAVDDPESWVVENVSAGGFGAIVPQLKGDWLRVGALVALQLDGGKDWLMGVVRRVSKASAQQARVGIQTLARAPRAANFAFGGAAEPGIVLADPKPAAEIGVALRPGVFVPGQNLEAQFGANQHVFMPQGMVERGEDYEIARYREMVREA